MASLVVKGSYDRIRVPPLAYILLVGEGRHKNFGRSLTK